MELLNIGEELKTARELQEISLEKVHEDTRIGIDFLESLEQGKAERMPHPVYARGFVRLYANYLGLDGDKFVEDFSNIYREEDQFGKINPDELPLSLRHTGQRSCMSVLLKALAFILILALVLSAGWYLYLSYNSEVPEEQQSPVISQPDSDTAEQESEPPLPETEGPETTPDDMYPEQGVSPELQQETGPAPERTEDQAQDPESVSELPASSKTDELIVEDFLEREAQINQEEPALSESEEQNQAENDDRTGIENSILVIRAREDCWLVAGVDDSRREVYLRSGENITLEFENSARIILGNAGGVDVYLNGEPYLFEASSGEVKTLEFSSSNPQSS
ncbi:MAG: DUF4115 domain-containing protein [Desulfonatronovibrio sp.]